MAQGYIRLPPDSTGTKVSTVGWTDGSDDVEAQQVALAQPTVTTGNITSTSDPNDRVAADVKGFSAAVVSLSGTYSMTIANIEGSADGGTTYLANPPFQITRGGSGTGGAGTGGGSLLVPVSNGTYVLLVNTAGLTHVRVRATVAVTGTAVVAIAPTAAPAAQVVSLWGSVGGATAADAVVNADVPGLPSRALAMGFNGTTWDRQRNNMDGTALASAARTGTANSSDLVNYNARGVQIMLNVTSAGTGSIQANVQGKDPVSAGYYKLAADPTAVTTAALFVYEFYPGASTAGAGGVTARVAASLPRTFRVIVTHGNANSITYSVGYSLIL